MDTTRLKQLAALCGLAGVMILLLMGAAAPRVFTPWSAFKGTNGIVIVTNRTTEQVRVDGAALQNQNSATSNALNGAFIRNFNGTGTNLSLYSSNTVSMALKVEGITGGTNMVEFMGTNSTTSIGPSGGVHIGGLGAIGGSNLVVEGTSLFRGTTNSGHVRYSPDNTFDIGAVGATRPRDLHLGRNFALLGTIVINGSAGLTSSGVGNLRLGDGAFGAFNRLIFGAASAASTSIGTTNGNLKIMGSDGNLITATNTLWFQGQHFSGATAGTNVTQQSGKVRLAAGGQSYYVTNNHITAASIVVATVNSDDVTALGTKAITSAGLLQLKLNAACTADCDISWFIATP